jgi:hypothetical protein
MEPNPTKEIHKHVCHACQRTFQSKQSLFAHLKHCQKYAEAKAQKNANGFPSGRQPHCGPPGGEPNQASSQGWTEAPMEIFKAYLADGGGSSAADPSTSLESSRRILVQRAKQQAIDAFYPSEGTVTPAMRGEAHRAIEIELSKDPLEAFPSTEILERAISIRDRIYAPYFQQEREERERQQVRTRECFEQALREQRRAEQAKLRKTVWLELARSKIVAGCARRGLSTANKLSLESLVELRMEDMLDGHESEEKADETIDFLLHQQFQIIDEKNAARSTAKRRQLTDQLVDAAIALAPIGLTVATPYLNRGFKWMEKQLKQATDRGSEASPPEHPEQKEPDNESQNTCKTQGEPNSPLDADPPSADLLQDHGASGPKNS